MYPSLSLGPLSLPTAQILALVSAWFGLTIMARAGRRMQLDPDMLWNLGTVALGAGLIVARLSHAVQYSPLYVEEPLLLVSLRPGGLLFWPGAAGALGAVFVYLVRKQLDPKDVGAAVVMGLLAGGAVLELSHFLTGATVGIKVAAPDALVAALDLLGYRIRVLLLEDEALRHPVALYRALGMALIVTAALSWGSWSRPGRLAGRALFALALLRIFVDGFAADGRLLGPWRATQVGSLVLALALAFLFASASSAAGIPGRQSGR